MLLFCGKFHSAQVTDLLHVLWISFREHHFHNTLQELQQFLPKKDKINNFCSHFSIGVYEKIYFES